MDRIGSEQIKGLWGGALSLLSAAEDEVNRLNVFPVPDGDTGSNMTATLRAGVERLREAPDSDVKLMLDSLADAALMGARGNSGVILSQYLRGFAGVQLADRGSMRPRELARALIMASDEAYNAVIRPVEGTILTVAKAAGEAALRCFQYGEIGCANVLASALQGARRALDNTPMLLDKLAQAGVVDAGGKGLVCMLEGMHLSLEAGPDSELVRFPGPAPAREAPPTAVMEVGEARYCTELIVAADPGFADALRLELEARGAESLLVVGGNGIIKVHAHMRDPGPALTAALALGELLEVKVENMGRQHEEAFGVEAEAPAGKGVGVVAVALGQGLIDDLTGFGVDRVIVGGQTMNPSVEEIVQAVESVDAAAVIILPNNSNVIMSAQSAAARASKPAAVVPTRFLLQSIPAMLAFNPELGLEENARRMEEAIRETEFGEVTYSVRGVSSPAGQVSQGDIIGMVGDGIVAVGRHLPKVALETLGVLFQGAPEAEIATIYHGEQVSGQEAETMAAELGEAFEELEITMRRGGQPHYFYLIMIE